MVRARESTSIRARRLARDPPRDDQLADNTWKDIIKRIREGGEQDAEQSLYDWIRHGVRLYLANHGCRDVEDIVHEVFITVLTVIRNHELPAPTWLPGFVRTIARRAAARSRKATRPRPGLGVVRDPRMVPDPEQQAIRMDQMELAGRILNALPFADCAILRRFYLEEHSAERICQELGLNLNQFRLRKSRAKQWLTHLMRAASERPRNRQGGARLLQQGAQKL